MKAERCQATAASGKPCSATPRPGRPFCLWHDEEAAEERREVSRRGGVARSNAARAKKQLPSGVLTNDELKGLVGVTIKRVLTGATEPAIGNSIAALSRAYVAVSEAGAVEAMQRRLDELEALAARRGSA